MEPSVAVDAYFSNAVDATVDITIAYERKKIARGEMSLDMSQTFDGGTLKRSGAIPRLELSQSDLIRLLSYLEGELQARDIVIAALKSEKAKQLLYQAKYGHLNLNDPLTALQRDSDVSGEGEDFDESSVGSLYENQLAYLERLVGVQRRSHEHARQVLYFVEKRHDRIVRQLEQERRWRAEDVMQGDSICVILENERERMQEELEYQKRQCQKAQLELAQAKEALSEERERHKTILVYLQEEYERLLMQMEAEFRRKLVGQEQLMNGFDRNGGEKRIELLQQETKTLREKWENEQGKVLDLKQIVQKQEDELNSMRHCASTSESAVASSKAPVGIQAEGGWTNGDLKNRARRSPSATSTSSDSCAIETTSIGVDLRQPQQLFHASGVLRRSISATSSPTYSMGGVLSAARNYISHAARSATGRRLTSSVSPPSKRWAQVVESTSVELMPTLPAENGPVEKKRSVSLSEPNGHTHIQPPAIDHQKSGANPKMLSTGTIRRKQLEEMEPEIAELEAVLKSLALEVSLTTGTGADAGYVQFPDVGQQAVSGGRKNENGQSRAEVVEVWWKTNVGGAPTTSDAGSDSKSSLPRHPASSGLVATLALSNSTDTNAMSDVGTEKRRRPPRIPIGVSRKPKSSTGPQGQSMRAPSSSMDQLSQASKSKPEMAEKKPAPLGCASPRLALQRKVKAISGFADRIQRRVVAGVVNQVAARQRPGAAGK